MFEVEAGPFFRNVGKREARPSTSRNARTDTAGARPQRLRGRTSGEIRSTVPLLSIIADR
jgi:hypothetical protein